jgi:hypothetical protein
MNVVWSVINSRYTLTCLLIKYKDFYNTNINTCDTALGRHGTLNDCSSDNWNSVVCMLSSTVLMLTRIFVCVCVCVWLLMWHQVTAGLPRTYVIYRIQRLSHRKSKMSRPFKSSVMLLCVRMVNSLRRSEMSPLILQQLHSN